MEERKSNRTRILKCRLTVQEYEKLEKKLQKSTCRKMSDYVRSCLFDKTITTAYRNTSVDDAITEMARVNSELNRIGNNFNQAVRRLNSLSEISEFRNWLAVYELEKKILFNKVEDIKNIIKTIVEKWLQ